MNEIINATASGCNTVKAIGDCLNAGTNCGSCKGEIASLLSEYVVQATDDPPLMNGSHPDSSEAKSNVPVCVI